MRCTLYVVRDVESSLPVDQTLPERRAERANVHPAPMTARAAAAAFLNAAILAMAKVRS